MLVKSKFFPQFVKTIKKLKLSSSQQHNEMLKMRSEMLKTKKKKRQNNQAREKFPDIFPGFPRKILKIFRFPGSKKGNSICDEVSSESNIRVVLHTAALMLNVKQETVNTKIKVNGLTRLGIKPKSTALEADVLTTRPYELLLHPYMSHSSNCIDMNLARRKISGFSCECSTVIFLQASVDTFGYKLLYEEYKTKYHLGWHLEGVPRLLGVCINDEHARIVIQVPEVIVM